MNKYELVKNDFTNMLVCASKLGYEYRVENEDNEGTFHEWTSSPIKAWEQILKFHAAVCEDSHIEIRKKNNKEKEHTHWIYLATTGGNTPNDGWMSDSCTCEIMETLMYSESDVLNATC